MYNKLTALGYEPCNSLAIREQLSLKETRTTYVMKCATKVPVGCFKVDGYLIKEGQKCDYMVLVQPDAKVVEFVQVLVELKGTDVEHAIKQLESSLSNSLLQHSSIRAKKARIVAQSFPSSKSNPAVAMAKRRFWNSYKCELKTVKSGQLDKV